MVIGMGKVQTIHRWLIFICNVQSCQTIATANIVNFPGFVTGQ
jgi:uncharacterized Rossmann fold enzyme